MYDESSHDDLESIIQDPSAQPCDLRLQYLRDITNIFSSEQELGRGGFGVVYKGVLSNGKMIAVKNLVSSEFQEKQFKNEVDNLMRVRHQNIVRLVGYCYETWMKYTEYNGVPVFAERPNRLLCFEYMPKGSLDRYISDESCGLDWNKRFKIIKGICYGLHYLHEECQINSSVIHLDLKPANILLDDNMVPKIADFGLSKFFNDEKVQTFATCVAGSYGYMAPEYVCNRIITTKADIYSLGVIIIEMITGRRISSFDVPTSCRDFVEPVLKNWRSRLEEAPRYSSLETDCQQIKSSLEIGLSCVKINRMERPTTREIIERLNRWGSTNCYVSDEERPPADKDANRNTSHQYAQDLSDRHGEQMGTVSTTPSGYFVENAGTGEVRLDGDSADGDLLPGIEEFQIVGEPRLGFTLRACCFPTNGTTLCDFQWVHCLENGISQRIEGATMYDYVVTADDVGTLLAVDCMPKDDNGRQGDFVREFANNKDEITCDPQMQNEIDLCIMTGRADFVVLLTNSPEEWKLAKLVLRRPGYQIKFIHTGEVVIDEKYGPNLQTKIPSGRTTQFVLVTSGGAKLPFNTQGITKPSNEDYDVRLRDLIILVMRTFKNKGLNRKDALDGPEGPEAQNADEPSSQWGSGGSPNLASDLEDANPSYTYLSTVPEEARSSSSEVIEDDPLPGIEGLRITGEAFPGRELVASGYPTNGTTTCYFEWLRYVEDGSVNFIEGASQPHYLVTADDVDVFLAIKIQALDDRRRKGNVYKAFADQRRKITCDPDTKEVIKKTLEMGNETYEVLLLQVRFLDMWVPAVLALGREGYSIKCNGQHDVVITEKFQQATAINISYQHRTEFSIISAEGVRYNLKPGDNALPRDTIVLVLRAFRLMAVELRSREEEGISSSRINEPKNPGESFTIN